MQQRWTIVLIQTFSGIINYFDPSDRIERTEYYICVNNDPAVLINAQLHQILITGSLS